MSSVGKICIYCSKPISEEERVACCDRCYAAHHEECWDRNGRCSTFRCAAPCAVSTYLQCCRSPSNVPTSSPRHAPCAAEKPIKERSTARMPEARPKAPAWSS